MKLYAYGLSRYWRDGVRRLDVVVTAIGVLDVMFFGYTQRHYHSEAAVYWFHICNAVRCLRLVKAMAAIQVGATLSRTLFRIMPAVANILCIIFAVSYGLALVGMEWYSGPPGDVHALVPDNPRLANSTDWLAVAPVLQFNNLGDALLTVYQVANVVSAHVGIPALELDGAATPLTRCAVRPCFLCVSAGELVRCDERCEPRVRRRRWPFSIVLFLHHSHLAGHAAAASVLWVCD